MNGQGQGPANRLILLERARIWPSNYTAFLRDNSASSKIVGSPERGTGSRVFAEEQDAAGSGFPGSPVAAPGEVAAYQAFMATLFDMFASTDGDAPLRAPIRFVGQADGFTENRFCDGATDHPACA